MSNTSLLYYASQIIDNLFQKITENEEKINGNSRKRGRPKKYPDSLIAKILFFGISNGARSTREIMKIAKKHLTDIHMPSYHTIHRRKKDIIEVVRRILRENRRGCRNSFIDSTTCEVVRAPRVRKHSIIRYKKFDFGWINSQRRFFFGFKLHLTVSGKGKILDYALTPASWHDSKAIGLLYLTKNVYGDRAYDSMKLARELIRRGIRLIAKRRRLRRGRRPKGYENLGRRWVVESVIRMLKELGLEKFRFRTYKSWQEHVGVVIFSALVLQRIMKMVGKNLFCFKHDFC